MGGATSGVQYMQWADREEDCSAPLLTGWFDGKYRRRLVSFDGAVWFVKTKIGGSQERNRENLASLLGAGWLNIAAVRVLSSEQFDDLRGTGINLPKSATDANTYLVRFAPDYGDDELPIKDPDMALAHELVFSLWIRRRDAHTFNRVYRHGTPIFFDSGTAFLGEPRLLDLDEFFQPGPDPGWPGLWRIGQADSIDLNTLELRRRERESFQHHDEQGRVVFPVLNRELFFDAMDHCRTKIDRLRPARIRELIDLSGQSQKDGEEIFDFLTETSQKIEDGMQRLRRTFLEPELSE